MFWLTGKTIKDGKEWHVYNYFVIRKVLTFKDGSYSLEEGKTGSTPIHQVSIKDCLAESEADFLRWYEKNKEL